MQCYMLSLCQHALCCKTGKPHHTWLHQEINLFNIWLNICSEYGIIQWSTIKHHCSGIAQSLGESAKGALVYTASIISYWIFDWIEWVIKPQCVVYYIRAAIEKSCKGTKIMNMNRRRQELQDLTACQWINISVQCPCFYRISTFPLLNTDHINSMHPDRMHQR